MPIPGSSIDVPCSLFSGLNTELSPSDLPEGVSPDNQNVVFLPGSTITRPALHKIFGAGLLNNNSVYYMKSYVQPNGHPLNLYLDGAGTLWKEDVDASGGTLSSLWSRVPAGLYGKSVTAFGREYIALSDGKRGQYVPLQYDGTNLDRVTMDGPAVGPTVAESVAAGSITAGVHQVVMMWQTRSGYISAPSPPVTWTASGSKKVTLSNIPIGPANVVARIFAFTGAGGANFFYIPTTIGAVQTTVLFDNTTTTVDVDFADNSLFAATAIDIPGNNMFAQVPLGPCAGFASYASRLFAWGQYNNLKNLVNMSFDGGTVGGAPCAWVVTGSGGALSTAGGGTWAAGPYWVITGDGSANRRGTVQQGVWRDAQHVAIIQPATQYSFRCWIRDPGNVQVGAIQADIFSPGAGLTYCSASIPVANVANGAFRQADFSPSVPNIPLPADLTLRVFGINLANGQQVYLDELEIYPTIQPYADTVSAVSYVDAPEQFDGTTGAIGPADDTSALRDFFDIRDTLYVLTADKLHATQDDGISEPAGWTVRRLADDCGSFGVNASSGGEDWRVWAGPTGLRIFEGQYPWKISQEIQTLFDGIDLSASSSIWVLNDPVARRIYTGAATAINNSLLVLDYRELDTAAEIGKGATIHISFTGKMIASDLARKWTKWVFGSGAGMRCGAVLSRPNNQTQTCFGPSDNRGNVYYLDSAKHTDDDYGQIQSYYTTYFFINHEAEMQLGVGSHRKLYTYLTVFVAGIGNLQITPYAASLTNPAPVLPPFPLSLSPSHDSEWPINVLSERCAFKLQPQPLTGQTDAYFSLQKVVVKLREDPWMPVRGAI